MNHCTRFTESWAQTMSNRDCSRAIKYEAAKRELRPLNVVPSEQCHKIWCLCSKSRQNYDNSSHDHISVANLKGLKTRSLSASVCLSVSLSHLNVSIRASSGLVYGETGRYPLYIITFVKCIRYWLNLVKMTEHRLPLLKAYRMLYVLQYKNMNNWVSRVCFTLY